MASGGPLLLLLLLLELVVLVRVLAVVVIVAVLLLLLLLFRFSLQIRRQGRGREGGGGLEVEGEGAFVGVVRADAKEEEVHDLVDLREGGREGGRGGREREGGRGVYERRGRTDPKTCLPILTGDHKVVEALGEERAAQRPSSLLQQGNRPFSAPSLLQERTRSTLWACVAPAIPPLLL